MTVYTITDWLGLVPICICVFFGIVGLRQLIKRKSLFKVDADIILLGIYYVVVIFAYLFFGLIIMTVLNGVVGVVISSMDKPVWSRYGIVAGMIMMAICSAVFIITRQPYAGIICFSALIVKGFLIIRDGGKK